MSDTLPKQKKLISISEAAKILGVSLDTVRRWDKSGVLHSERPDGKNRYFSLEELEKHKSNQPLSISEAAKELNVSPTTLRRLEARGLIKPNRNSAGERVFYRDSIEDFLKSDYFLRKKQVKEKIIEPSQKEEGLLENYITPNEAQPLQERDLKRDVDVYSPTSFESFKEISLSQNLKTLQRTPELIATTVVFLLLIAIGIRNTMFFTVKTITSSPTPSVLSETAIIGEIVPSPTPTSASSSAILGLSRTEEISTSSADAVSTASADTIEPADTVEPKVILTIKADNKSAIVNIRQKPTTTSEKIGKAKDGDTFEFVSIDSGWYGVKLADGSTGFISDKFITTGETNNQ